MEKLKRVCLLLSCLICIFIALLSMAQPGETYMTAAQAQKKFGKSTFDAAKFKAGDRKTKGGMAADLVLKKTFVGKSLKSVTELLGSPDGYFENDGIPAYVISADVTKKDIWQIIFLPDKDWKKVDEVKIHKNCCK